MKGSFGGQLAGASPERGGGDVVHQLGERQRVGGGPAAAAHRLQRETRQVRGADLAGCSAGEEQLSSQREGNGHLEVKSIRHCSIRSHPCTQLNISTRPARNRGTGLCRIMQTIQKANLVLHPLSSTTQMIDSIRDAL